MVVIIASAEMLPGCCCWSASICQTRRFWAARPFSGAVPILARSAAEGARFPLLLSPQARLSEPVALLPAQSSGEASSITEVPSAGQTFEKPIIPRFLLTMPPACSSRPFAAAGPNRARIRQALHRLSPWQGTGGQIRFDGTGQNTRSDVAMGHSRRPRDLPHAGGGFRNSIHTRTTTP